MRLKVTGKRTKPKPMKQEITLPPRLSAALDAFIARQPDPKPSRPEVIRRVLAERLAREGLGAAGLDLPRDVNGSIEGSGIRSASGKTT